MSESCGTCRYGLKTGHFDEALCRRHAPVVQPIVTMNRYEETCAKWPKMSETRDWCGDYEPAPSDIDSEGR